MIVTINTDASYHPDHNVGGYAFWIVCNQGRIKMSGPLRDVKTSRDAEVMCIANALHTLWKSTVITGVTKIIINSDCKPAFQCIETPHPDTPQSICAEILDKLRLKYFVFDKPIHEFRHVKAHSGTSEARKWVNNWCDKMAGEHMVAMVKEKKNATIFGAIKSN